LLTCGHGVCFSASMLLRSYNIATARAVVRDVLIHHTPRAVLRSRCTCKAANGPTPSYLSNRLATRPRGCCPLCPIATRSCAPHGVAVVVTIKSSSSRLSSSAAASPHGGARRRPGYQRENSSRAHGSKRGRRRLAVWALIDRPGVTIPTREELVLDRSAYPRLLATLLRVAVVSLYM
jgi:hypothetical protein